FHLSPMFPMPAAFMGPTAGIADTASHSLWSQIATLDAPCVERPSRLRVSGTSHSLVAPGRSASRDAACWPAVLWFVALRLHLPSPCSCRARGYAPALF